MCDKYNSASSYNTLYENTDCVKQNQIIDQQTYYQYTNMQINNSFPVSSNGDMYNYGSSQNFPKNQNNSQMQCQENIDFTNWDNRALTDLDKLKLPDKIDLIEITSKDLSPASYCSNMDLLIPDCYKQQVKDVNYYNNQWYYNTNCNQKVFDYPSCAQITDNTNVAASNKYCSIQRSHDADLSIKNYSFINEYMNDHPDSYYRNNSAKINDNLYYGNKFHQGTSGVDNMESNYFPEAIDTTNITFEPIDQQTECSNESDIVVEESDEDVTDYSEEPEKRICYNLNTCTICNTTYTPLGRQFYFITSETPLTMSSQTSVYNKIVELLGFIASGRNYLCSECLGLINTIDHLQLKLDNFTTELTTKFQKTCAHNNITPNKEGTKRKLKRIFIKSPRIYQCKICKKIISIKKLCQKHIKKHKSHGLLCELCGRIFSSYKSFLRHKRMHRRKLIFKINAFKCSSCSKIFRTKSNLKEHENYCLGILPFSCKQPNCDKKFASITKLKNHTKLKHDKKFIAICSICNIGFVKLSDYKSHMITHSTDKKFSCSKCNKSYKTLSNLNFHMKIHNDKMPFNCTICERGFMRKEYLEAHVNNHNGIKNFACSLCEKKFVSQKNLDSHLKYHEGNVKKNTCNICGKTMTTGFEEHLRIHNNLREFECDKCDFKFNTKGSLYKHKKSKHGKDETIK